jgi:hypothetical protein
VSLEFPSRGESGSRAMVSLELPSRGKSGSRAMVSLEFPSRGKSGSRAMVSLELPSRGKSGSRAKVSLKWLAIGQSGSSASNRHQTQSSEIGGEGTIGLSLCGRICIPSESLKTPSEASSQIESSPWIVDIIVSRVADLFQHRLQYVANITITIKLEGTVLLVDETVSGRSARLVDIKRNHRRLVRHRRSVLVTMLNGYIHVWPPPSSLTVWYLLSMKLLPVSTVGLGETSSKETIIGLNLAQFCICDGCFIAQVNFDPSASRILNRSTSTEHPKPCFSIPAFGIEFERSYH